MSSAYFLARKLVAVTLDAACSATEGLWVGVAGNVSVKMADPAVQNNTGPDVVVPVNVGYNPISVTKVNTTGTTATGLFLAY